ncbi:hypothetical protein H0E87_003001 [Populus deltoides]|uniref:Uncharacterized protein n=1 Tax=Populus deltoides TaxID=3696 RepID=A0A8T2ZXY6_POPDE|nr:hypothetical protein H0E87_003001 [Populus deltoides]
MSLLPFVKLCLREDESILPAKQTPPWPKAFFIKFSVGRFVNVYHSEGLIQYPAGEIANFCLCFEPVEVGSLYNTFYHPMEEFISRDGAAKFFSGMLAFFDVKESVDQSIFDNFFSKTRSMADDARAHDRKIVPVAVEVIIDLWEEFHPGTFEFSIPNYVDEIMGKGSENGVSYSSLQSFGKMNPGCKNSTTSKFQPETPPVLNNYQSITNPILTLKDTVSPVSLGKKFSKHNSPLGSTSNPAARHSITIDRTGNQDLA